MFFGKNKNIYIIASIGIASIGIAPVIGIKLTNWMEDIRDDDF